jgi:mannose-6-phosphate isomerase
MKQLYPLKFKPVILDKMWGGSKLKEVLHKPTISVKAGESWEISGVKGNISMVSNGYLKGNNLEELIEVYLGDLVGERIYNQFGTQFPLLIKFIDANDALSIQVHPDDELAMKRHESFGKTEMWYIMQADEGAGLIVGFNRTVSKEVYLKHLAEKRLTAILNTEPVKEGDVFFLPAGRVHAIGSGILLTEIQQTSDITYRIYDFDRTDTDGKSRELHTELAVDSIDYSFHNDYKTSYSDVPGKPSKLVECKYFTVNKLSLDSPETKNTGELDCFVIYICVRGKCQLLTPGNKAVPLQMGESLLVPAALGHYTIEPDPGTQLLEVYIDPVPGSEL